jgi:hypothetical protein
VPLSRCLPLLPPLSRCPPPLSRWLPPPPPLLPRDGHRCRSWADASGAAATKAASTAVATKV